MSDLSPAVKNAFRQSRRALRMIKNLKLCDIQAHWDRWDETRGQYGCNRNRCPVCRANAAALGTAADRVINPRKAHLWWNQPWTLVEGCTRCSAGCKDCWALAMEKRTGRTVECGGVRLRWGRLDEPLHWRKPRVVAVWNDLFHKDVLLAFRVRAMNVMREAEQHTFIVLTKRATAMREHFEAVGPPSNVILGVTCEMDKYIGRVEELVRTPAAVRFVNAHLLGPLDLGAIIGGRGEYHQDERGFPGHHHCLKCGCEWEADEEAGGIHICPPGFGPGLDAVFFECNRPFHGDPAEWWGWCKLPVEQATAAGVAVWVKQGPLPSGRVTHDLEDFPPWARLRQFPKQEGGDE